MLRFCENVVFCKFKELEKISVINWDKLDKEDVFLKFEIVLFLLLLLNVKC